MQVEFAEVSIDDVLDYFVKGYNFNDLKMVHYETFLDSRKGKVIYKLLLEKKSKEISSESQ